MEGSPDHSGTEMADLRPQVLGSTLNHLHIRHVLRGSAGQIQHRGLGIKGQDLAAERGEGDG